MQVVYVFQIINSRRINLKHIFVINSVAGTGSSIRRVLPRIEVCIKRMKLDAEIYFTQSKITCMEFCKSKALSGEHIRIYACGGDGTIFDVVNSTKGFGNVEIAAIPTGSGNDFIRLFGTKEEFCNISAQVNGMPIKIDAISCLGKLAVNQCSMGFDAEICSKQIDLKKIPFVSGEAAYTASIFYCLFKKAEHHFKVTIDDYEPVSKNFLFALCANSRWYGGGYMGAPLAVPDDGLLDFILVEKDVSKAKMIMLSQKYKKGQHLGWERTTFLRGKKMVVESDEPVPVNIDGECENVTKCTFEIVPDAVNFVIPTSSNYIKNRKSGIISPYS